METPSAEEWDVLLEQKMLFEVQQGIRKWIVIVKTLGLDDQSRDEWSKVFQSEVIFFVNECVGKAVARENKLLKKIEMLMVKSQSLRKSLNIKLPLFESTNKGYYHDENYLTEQVKIWQNEFIERVHEVDNLKSHRDEISNSLGISPFYIRDMPLPNEEEMVVYKQKIRELETEKEHRHEKYLKLKLKIIEVANELSYEPKFDFEKYMIYSDSNDVDVSEQNMAMIEDFHNNLMQAREHIKSELVKYWENLEHLWIEEDCKYVNDFIQNHLGINYKTLGAVKREVKRCEEMRSTNLKKLIEILRQELLELWDKAGFSQQQREPFREQMEDDRYTEDLLTLHDLQIAKVKKFMEDNKNIYELLHERDVMYQRMKDFESRANAPDRFKNRGGQLLKDEKERKAVLKKIPLIDHNLLDVVNEFEMNHNEKFLYRGETIEDLIYKARENIKNEKKLQMSAGKQKRDITMSASKLTPRTLFSCKSPSRLQVPVNRFHLTPYNVRTPIRTSKSLPARKVIVSRRSISTAKFRCSSEKKKRISAIRVSKNAEANENDAGYSRFENEMSKRKAFRSTISIHSPHSSQLNPVIWVDTPTAVELKLRTAPCSSK